jgi:hypothetical protein
MTMGWLPKRLADEFFRQAPGRAFGVKEAARGVHRAVDGKPYCRPTT